VSSASSSYGRSRDPPSKKKVIIEKRNKKLKEKREHTKMITWGFLYTYLRAI
jgi:hypothetical protein